ncbi:MULTISPECIES: acyl-CoA dehydrogenase family protein [unclassified Haladaptatus]|uniref:acyl-CoA dehydrogenase family protein n=1 Tax=unclassified Haladaptatus TaxID=2622732 RepID=UPI00209C58B7|nr:MULTISPECIES: acyl-CoA dehydrogenase family protein [unclassified Haladaptatus]MCO8242737.1 acyl-CoA dehydrogenase family protein [Haladaptatus sp. AB643]MCO8252496.1 acyl-CoA dehydrogenase family protein [Haladaptatus sp. AB618]
MLDYVELEADLGQEERMVRDTAREFVEEHVKPDIGDHFEAGTFPEEIIPEMGELGFYAPNLDGYGLPNLSETAYGLLMQELEACDSGLRSMASVQGALVMYPIHAYGSEAQKDRWLPDLGEGKAVGCFGLTEPEHGSNPSRMETYAEKEGDEYVLNGSKTWITNSPISDVAVVWARDRSAEDSPVRGFLVETDRDGVTTNKIGDKLSLRASITGEISLQNVTIPEDSVLPGVTGMKGPLSCLTQARYGIAWGAIGAARDCFETARDYATERDQFGGPIARFQLQQDKLAEMATQITTSQLLVHRLAELKERGDLRPQHVSMAKRNNVRMARDQARVAREMLGGNGITTDYPPMRHMANMETVYTYEGTHDIHTLVLGQDLTGIAAFE